MSLDNSERWHKPKDPVQESNERAFPPRKYYPEWDPPYPEWLAKNEKDDKDSENRRKAALNQAKDQGQKPSDNVIKFPDKRGETGNHKEPDLAA